MTARTPIACLCLVVAMTVYAVLSEAAQAIAGVLP